MVQQVGTTIKGGSKGMAIFKINNIDKNLKEDIYLFIYLYFKDTQAYWNLSYTDDTIIMAILWDDLEKFKSDFFRKFNIKLQD